LPFPMDTCSSLVGQAPGPAEPVPVGEGCGVPPVGPGDVGVTVTVLVTVGAAAGEPEGPQAVASSAVPASSAAVIRCRGTGRDVTVTSFPHLAAHYQPCPLDGGAGAPVAGPRRPAQPRHRRAPPGLATAPGQARQ